MKLDAFRIPAWKPLLVRIGEGCEDPREDLDEEWLDGRDARADDGYVDLETGP